MIRYAYIIPFLPLLSFFINIAVGKRLPRKGDWVSLATIATCLAMLMKKDSSGRNGMM